MAKLGQIDTVEDRIIHLIRSLKKADQNAAEIKSKTLMYIKKHKAENKKIEHKSNVSHRDI